MGPGEQTLRAGATLSSSRAKIESAESSRTPRASITAALVNDYDVVLAGLAHMLD